MDFTQRKLTKAEWDSIEVPLAPGEQYICDLIIKGFHDVNLTQNRTKTLLQFMKIGFTVAIDQYLYDQYFRTTVSDLLDKYRAKVPLLKTLVLQPSSGLTTGLKKADLIRLQNTDRQLKEHTQTGVIFEFVLVDLLKKFLALAGSKGGGKGAKDSGVSTSTTAAVGQVWIQPFFTLQALLRYHVDINQSLRTVLTDLLEPFVEQVRLADVVARGYELLEKNEYLLKYADETLYEHQKQLFSICKQPDPKLLLYIAPTGTGKTLSPLGLSETKRIIFVCAARHVGLALAKAAISCHKKVAFAFGCHDAEDIRLHYFAAKEYTKNKKSGGIGKVDNTQGEKVEIIISDIQSYLPAMYYLLAFNAAADIILYWDEPTISLDYETHDFHAIIQKNWRDNLIPNVVLSSATLPQRAELGPTISDFKARFPQAAVHDIVSYDCKKTIPLVNREGYVEMPHYFSADYAIIRQVVAHCTEYKTLLRYLDLQEAIHFILLVLPDIEASGNTLSQRLALDLHFPTLDTVTMGNIKLYYLTLLGNLDQARWSTVFKTLVERRQKRQVSNIHIVTTDAHTLTDGPTIFLADDVHKMAQFYIQSANIAPITMHDMLTTIQHNNTINDKVRLMQKKYEDGTRGDEGKEKKMANDERLDPAMKKLKQDMETAYTQLRSIALNPVYVPNTRDHLYKYAPQAVGGTMHAVGGTMQAVGGTSSNHLPFSSDISEEHVEQLMALDDVADTWKLLLLMGIGVFAGGAGASGAQGASETSCTSGTAGTSGTGRYTEIMKKLAQEQKLYLIIASTDYIYGTNYQFCHGYIGKDLAQMSEEKCIQAMGRVGRNKLQQDYTIRFRDDALLSKLFLGADDKPEVRNMRKLFCSV